MPTHAAATVSVALCTHNGARFIGEQVASILAQDTMPDEIVLSDDASTDATVSIVEAALADRGPGAPRLIVLRNTSALGVTRNFEQAVRACSGALIALCDQDDVWRSDRVSAAVARFAADPDLDLLFSDAALIDGQGRPIDGSLLGRLEVGERARADLSTERAFDLLIRRNVVTGATVMFRRRLLDDALPFPDDWVHDEWLAVVAAAVGRVGLLDDRPVAYRLHGSNQIGVTRPTLRRKVRRVLEPRGGRNLRLARMSSQLAERLAQLGARVPEGRTEMAAEKAAGEALRLELPSSRLRRVRRVLKLRRTGWYDEYSSQGQLDVLRDLLQSHRTTA